MKTINKDCKNKFENKYRELSNEEKITIYLIKKEFIINRYRICQKNHEAQKISGNIEVNIESAFNKYKYPIDIGKLIISKIVTYDKDSFDKIRVKYFI